MGHAVLVHKLFGHRAKIGLITVNPGLNSLGHVVWEFEKGQESRNVTDKAARIVVSLGGRCAEILHGGIGQLGFGASSDLENATRAANLMVVHGVTPTAIDRFVSPKDEAEVRKPGTEWLSYLNGKTIELLEPHVDHSFAPQTRFFRAGFVRWR
jgi:ATP-dependent Zn protease